MAGQALQQRWRRKKWKQKKRKQVQEGACRFSVGMCCKMDGVMGKVGR
jgi:hypothetical protein